MKDNISNKIKAIKTRIVKSKSTAKEQIVSREINNSLSIAIRNKKEAESFETELKSAILIAKSQ